MRKLHRFFILTDRTENDRRIKRKSKLKSGFCDIEFVPAVKFRVRSVNGGSEVCVGKFAVNLICVLLLVSEWIEDVSGCISPSRKILNSVREKSNVYVFVEKNIRLYSVFLRDKNFHWYTQQLC